MNTNLPCELATAHETSAPSWSQATCGVANAFVSSKPCDQKSLACCPCTKGLQCTSHLGTSYCTKSNSLGICNSYRPLAVTPQQQTLAGTFCPLPETSELMHTCCKRRAGTRDTCTECLLSLVQFEAFARGFMMLCGGPAIHLFSATELERLVCGNPLLDFDAMQANARYDGGYSPEHRVRLHHNFLLAGHALCLAPRQMQGLCMC